MARERRGYRAKFQKSTTIENVNLLQSHKVENNIFFLFQQRKESLVTYIDDYCRFLFPLVFLLFNGCYWWYYLIQT